MKWINRLIPTNGTIIEKVDLNCVKFCKCEGEPQRTKSLRNLRELFKHTFNSKNEINKKSFLYYIQYFCELYDFEDVTPKQICESLDDFKGFTLSIYQYFSKQFHELSNKELLDFLQIPENYYVIKAIEIISKVDFIIDQTFETLLISKFVNVIELINSINLDNISLKHLKNLKEQLDTSSNEQLQENGQVQNSEHKENNTEIQGTAVIEESETDNESGSISSSSIYSIIHYDGTLDITKFLFMKQMKITYDVDDIEPITYCEYKKSDEDNTQKVICTHLNVIPLLLILKSISTIICKKISKESLLAKILQNDNLKAIAELILNYSPQNNSIDQKLQINNYLNSIILAFIQSPSYNKKQNQIYFKDNILPLLINITENTNNTIFINNYPMIIESLKKSDNTVINEFYKLNGIKALKDILIENVDNEKIRDICLNSLKELLFIGDDTILEDISYQESPYQLITFEFPAIPKNLIDVIKSKDTLKNYLDIVITVNNEYIQHDLVVHLFYLVKLIKCNYFILENYNVFLELINHIENFNQKTVNNIMETLYFVMEIYDYLPLKELMCIGIYLQGTLNPRITKSVCDLLLKLMNSSSRYKDSFNDIGFITIIANSFHDFACTLNYNITQNMNEKRKTPVNCITPTFSNRHRSINAEKILNLQNIEVLLINFHCITECLIELISENENNLLLFRATQQNALSQLLLEDKLREDVLKIYHIIISYCFSNTNKANIDNAFNSEEGISPEYLKLIELLQLRQYPAEFKIDILYEINELNIECDQAKNIFRESGGYICILSLLSELGGIWSNKTVTTPVSSNRENDVCLTPVITRDVSVDRLSITSINDLISGANQLDSINDYIKQSFVMKKMKIKKEENYEIDKHVSSFVLFQLLLTTLIMSLKNMPMNRRFFLKNFDKKSFSDLLYMTGIFSTNAGIIIYGYLFALLTEDLSIIEMFNQNNKILEDIQDIEESSDDDLPIITRSKSDYFDNWNDKDIKKINKNGYNEFRYYDFSTVAARHYNLIIHENKEKLLKYKFINSYGIPVVLNILQNSTDPNTTYTILEIINVLLNSYKYNQIMAYKTKTLLSSFLHILYSSDIKSKYPIKQLQYLMLSENKKIVTDPALLSQWDTCFEIIHSLAKLIIKIGIEDYDSQFLLEKYNEISLKCEKYKKENETENQELQNIKSSILNLMSNALKIKNNFSYIHFDSSIDINSYILLENIPDGLFPTNYGYSVIMNFRICQFNTNKTLNIVDIYDTRTNNCVLTLSINRSTNNNLKRLCIKTNKTQTYLENFILMENKYYEIIITHQPNKYLRTLSFTGSSLNVYINGEQYDNIKNDYIDTPIATQYLQCKIGEVVESLNNKDENEKAELTTQVKWDFGVCHLINNALEPSIAQKIFLPTVDIQTIKFPEDKTLISLCSKNVIDNISEFKDEGVIKYYRLILNNTKSLNGITNKNICSINEGNISQFGIIKGAYCEYNPNLFSNSIWRFGGMSILLKIMENENNEKDFNTSLNLVMDAIKSNIRNASDMDQDHKYEIFANIIKNKKNLITNTTVENLFEMVKTPKDGFYKFYKYIFLDFDIWKETSVEIQSHMLRQFFYFINKNNTNYLINIDNLIKNSIIKKFAIALREEIFDKELIPKIIEIIMICLKHHYTKNQLKLLVSYISSTLPKVSTIETKTENKTSINSCDDISANSGTTINKNRNKSGSFSINSSFSSLSIDTSFSRLRKRKPSKIDTELSLHTGINSGVEYFQSNDDSSLYSVYTRNKLLEAIYNVLTDTTDNNKYASDFSKSIEIQWFTYFINKKMCPLTMILIMKILTKLLQIQDYQYKTSFKNDIKMYKLMNVNLPNYYKVCQVYHSLLAMTFETPINTIPLNANFDLITLKRLYKSTIQNSNNNNSNTQYNVDSLLVFLKMVKEAIKICIDNLNRNQDKIDFYQFSNKKNLSHLRLDLNGNAPVINITSDTKSPQNLLIHNIHDKHDNRINNYDNNLLSINTIKTSSSASLATPITPKTPRTPRTPRTPLINLSEKTKKKIDIIDLIENETTLFIYQDSDDINKKLSSSIQFIENIFSFFLHLFSLNIKKLKLLFCENDVIYELMDTMNEIVNNNFSILEIPIVSSSRNDNLNVLSANSNESLNDSSYDQINQSLNIRELGINNIKEKFELPIYNFIIAIATSSIAEDWKPLYALNNVINSLSNFSLDFKNSMSINVYKHVITKLLLISNKNIETLIDPKIISNIFKFINNVTDYVYINKITKLSKWILKFLNTIITKIQDTNNDKYNTSLTGLYKCWNRIVLYFFFYDHSFEDISNIINYGIKLKHITFNNENNDQDFFNCLLLNIYNYIIINEENTDLCLYEAWNMIINNRISEFKKIIKLKSDEKIADDEIKYLTDSILPNNQLKEYIKSYQMNLSELFSEYFSLSWKNFRNQEQNKINEYNSKKGNESPTKYVSPRPSSNSNSEENEEVNSVQYRILERLKVIQDRTVISAKRLLLDKMETSKILEIEWSKILYNLYREKAIWEKHNDEIVYWKLDFTEGPDKTRQKLRLNLNFDKELLKLNNENEISDVNSAYLLEGKQSNSSNNDDGTKISNNFVKNKTEVADYLKKSIETHKRIEEKNKLNNIKNSYDNSFINMPSTPSITSKPNFDELLSSHKNENLNKKTPETSEIPKINKLEPNNLNNDNEISDPSNVFINNDNNNDKGVLVYNNESNVDSNNNANELLPTSPEDKNVIENINERISRLIDPEDKKIELYNAARIKGLDICEGLIILGDTNVYFIENYLKKQGNEIDNISNIPIEERNPFYIILISSTQQNLLKNSKTEQYTYDYIKWSQSDIVDIKKRRFIFRNVGIEFFLSNGRSYLFTFENKERDTIYNKLYSKINANLYGKEILPENNEESPFGIKIPNLLSENYNLDKIRKKWEKRKISNFEYIFELNSMAGRSYNDLTQYPIFPWILSNYESPRIDLDEPSNFRDLSKPMGAQDEERANKIKERYDNWEDPEGKPAFHYGTHYSSAMIVCTYLMRLEPFTDQYLKLQGGHFDHADRLFFSIERTWKSAARENTTDVRELIPEFFYLPEFFLNKNKFNLGMKHDKSHIDNVALPAWAYNDPRLFIFIHRQALESEYVSSNLHKWIDLIFGYKQQGEEAINALNVFYHLSYEGAVNIDDIQDPVERVSTINIIHNFGQTPSQLFREPHPPRQEKVTDKIRFLLSTQYDYLVPSSSPLKTIEYPVGEITFINDTKYFILKEYQTMIPNTLKYAEWNFFDKRIRICNYETNKVINCSNDILHTGDITCLKFADQDTMITGGSDMVICIWKFYLGKYIKFTLQSILRGHKSPISCISVSRKHSIIVSSSINDNYVIIWDLNRYIYVHSLEIKEKLLACEISDIWGNIVLCCTSSIYIYSINGELLVQHPINIPVTSCAVYDCTEIGENMTTIVTGHKNGLIKIWNYSYRISEEEKSVIWEINLGRTIETNLSSIKALCIPSSHRFIIAGDSKGVIHPWIMLDGSGTTIHYCGSEDACKACNSKFAVFDRFKMIRCVGCGYFYCNECIIGIKEFENDNKICKLCFKKIYAIDTAKSNKNKHSSSLTIYKEPIINQDQNEQSEDHTSDNNESSKNEEDSKDKEKPTIAINIINSGSQQELQQ